MGGIGGISPARLYSIRDLAQLTGLGKSTVAEYCKLPALRQYSVEVPGRKYPLWDHRAAGELLAMYRRKKKRVGRPRRRGPAPQPALGVPKARLRREADDDQ